MGKYDLKPTDIELGIRRILTEAYATSNVCDEPELIYIAGGPGSGKTSIEKFLKRNLAQNEKDAFIINSDKIAEYHPQYDEAIEELPEECYRITRQFVRPATPVIYDELRKNRITLLNENTLDHGDTDVEQARKFKDAGYKIVVNYMVEDILETRLCCEERDAATLRLGMTPRGCSKETQERMYNSSLPTIKRLIEEGLVDGVNLYKRGENINKPPILVHELDDEGYKGFEEAIIQERMKKRIKLFKEPGNYFSRLKSARETIEAYGQNPALTENSLNKLNELERDFVVELSKYLAAPEKYFEIGTSNKQLRLEER